MRCSFLVTREPPTERKPDFQPKTRAYPLLAAQFSRRCFVLREMMFLQDTVPPFGPTPNQLFDHYFKDFTNKTWGNISPFYQLDSFDYTILVVYFVLLGVLAIYGGYRIKQVVDFWRYRRIKPKPKALFSEDDLPHITVQLPLFNEMYVVERLLKAVTEIDYPRSKFEIQVLDDSTDETQALALKTVE